MSVLKQFRSDLFNRNNDPFSLIPIWTLFSPRPMKNCCLLGYREKLQNNTTSEIIIVNNFTPRWYLSLWYGQRRDVKFILGIRKQLITCRNSKHLFTRSTSFKLINNYIFHFNNPTQINERQLIYIIKGGYFLSKKDKLLFVAPIKKKFE
ncbi:hypothetical protein [Chryseobacterium sp.]|uniref:hypothetical protein n=1 Tax=Chryseobacterium sp. TaxID=1871047 RepID=UPI0028A20654|nr:hypothetical protein [Chryseobacterium sp.]